MLELRVKINDFKAWIDQNDKRLSDQGKQYFKRDNGQPTSVDGFVTTKTNRLEPPSDIAMPFSHLESLVRQQARVFLNMAQEIIKLNNPEFNKVMVYQVYMSLLL